MKIQIVSKRYAEALFSQINKDKTVLNSVKVELDELSNLFHSSKDFSQIILNPIISNNEKKLVFKGLKDKGSISKILYEFIQLLIEKKRLNLLLEINECLNLLIMKEKGELYAEASFALEADDKIKNELIKKLSVVTGKNIVLKDSVDSSLIGGIKVKVGTVLYDTTIKGQLEKLKSNLI